MSAVNRSPRLEFPAGQRQTLAIHWLSDEHALADFSSFTLTVREDPDYLTRTDPNTADPLGQSWATVNCSPAYDTAGEVLSVSFTIPTNAGTRRYALDVRGTLTVGGGTVFLYPCTWLSVDVTC